MRVITMRCLFCCVSGWMLTTGTIYGADVSASHLYLSLGVAKTRLIPYEPLLLRVVISNKSDSVVLLIPGRWESLVGIEMREELQKDWQPLIRWWRPEVSQPPLPALELEPGHAASVDMGFYPFNQQGEWLFLRGHTYQLQALLVSSDPALHLLSEVQTIQILAPSEEEGQAIADIETSKTLRFYLLPEQIAFDSISTVEIADTFVRRFPRSSLTAYIATTKKFRAEQTNDVDVRLSKFRKEILKIQRH